MSDTGMSDTGLHRARHAINLVRHAMNLAPQTMVRPLLWEPDMVRRSAMVPLE
jgi:hypothetical protein